MSFFSISSNLTGALRTKIKRANKAKYGTIKPSRHIRGNMENIANFMNHLKIKGSSKASMVAGRSGNKMDFSCTVKS
ncbi:hypothetical protein MTR_6g017320 [Medicago truncatula]|uniref:Uncharacterized protein n=1 Tax=Medicago truncatula TaxID=3880 RepID=A0A072U896_MEDTR|nr:hypothetical protein MTR_6g017320 [Medicago truncatula]